MGSGTAEAEREGRSIDIMLEIWMPYLLRGMLETCPPSSAMQGRVQSTDPFSLFKRWEEYKTPVHSPPHMWIREKGAQAVCVCVCVCMLV